ncbi:MarP family serine protease [Corynebacterium liangguodongii]|uniref:Uncharacterized protein n=1 Tax=Corynebacterium liangguodongii TaxID=2079535 RepID=A0A2S0WBT1_9CORY|nr:MarP family serine protease [Corynebacterium liangguodongii]AWB83223.1 hypothetical protein C3E79_00940 [Corynebacterium liangguodongii]PWB98680.1 hypothetical protein DF219_10670 [Corynebacterium liangguodongii]
MEPAIIVDAILAAALVAAWISGWRQGALGAILSMVGVLSGLIVGLAVAPALVNLSTQRAGKLAILLAVVVLFVSMGNFVGRIVGARVRRGGVFDSILGALVQAAAVALVLWFISLPLASTAPGKVGQGIRQSAILGVIDSLAPAPLESVPARLAALISESGLPPLVSPFATPVGQQVDAPSSAAIDAEVVAAVRPSVVHVMGEAGVCGRRLMGSGFVAAQDYVVTNAHVVAGTQTVSLDTVLGVKAAVVVYYNPDVDIAVLHSPGLGLDPIAAAEGELAAGDDAAVMGYPHSGPFEATPARVRSRITIAGPDIYATGRVEREAYTLRGTIRQGNSGGPLLTPRGEVAGVIFGASVDSEETGYALTWRQVAGVVGRFENLTAPVDTQACVVG